MEPDDLTGLIFDIKRDCSEDGPGIRTTVFFKGCPLSCSWCQNPEGMSANPSISYSSARCDPSVCGGYACIDTCPLKLPVIDPENKKINLDHSSCNRCDKCFDVCTPHALEPLGSWWTVNELIEKILIDKAYFDSTGGGVTASGGEPTLQMEFLHHFLKALKQVNMNAGLETSGMFPLNPFKRLILPYLDFIYFDLKLIDPEDSRQYTGASNDLIIDNFLFLYNETTVPIIPRVPLIPGITATEENLSRISHFLKAHGITACALIPYNPFWHDKAIKTGIPINYSRSELMSQREEEDCIHYFSV